MLESISAAVMASAERTPDGLAFRFLGDADDDIEELSYGELDRRARSVAVRLTEHASVGDRVLVLCPPGLDYVVALVAAMHAGVTAVPAFPPQSLHRAGERLSSILNNAGVEVALVSSMVASMLPMVAKPGDPISRLKLVLADEPEDASASFKPRTAQPDELAMLQYTSGSTDDPRGVMLSHEALMANCREMAARVSAGRHTHVVSWLPPYHDMGLVGCILTPILIGARVTMMSPLSFLADPYRWLAAVTKYSGMVSGAPDFAYELCTRRITDEQRDRLSLGSWGVAFNGADRVHAATMREFSARFASAGFSPKAWRPCYGLAEATLCVSLPTRSGRPKVRRLVAEALQHGEVREAGRDEPGLELVACGSPVSDTRVRIVDPGTGRALPTDTVGEIWVSGPGVGRGYFGRAGDTTATFNNQLLLSDGRRYLRTGDLGFLDLDGDLFVVARLRDLIVIRGRNYYPEDIERTVGRAHEGLRVGGTAAFEVLAAGENRLVVVQEVRDPKKAQYKPMGRAIREAVARDFQLPVHTLVLSPPRTIPRTSSGKIQRRQTRARMIVGALAGVVSALGDRRAYPRATGEFPAVPDAGSAELSGEYLMLSDELERKVAACLAKHLDRKQVGPDEDFFALGGHSLLATRVISELRETLEVDLPLRLLFDSPTARALAANIRSVERSLAVPTIPRLVRGRSLPMSYAQERILFMHLLDPESAAYNVGGGLQLDGPLDAGALAEAIRDVMKRHEILRAKYELTTMGVVQTLRDEIELPVERVDCTAAPDPAAWSEQLASELLRAPFDLMRDVLVRAAIHKLGPHTHRVVLSAHHVVADGWSLDVALQELIDFYQARRDGRVHRPEPLKPQYVDYAAWQRRFLDSGHIAGQMEYWRHRLADAPKMLPLPTDHPRPSQQGHTGDRVRFGVSPELVQRLADLGRAQGATLFMVLLAGLQVVLSRHAGVTDICVGTPIANRNWRASERLIGTFVNSLVMRASSAEDPTFVELLARVREVCLGAYDNQDLPFERLVEELRPARDLSISPLFQVFLDFQTMRFRPIDDGAIEVSPVSVRRFASQFDLAFSFLDHGDGMLGQVEYRTDIFEHATVGSYVHHLMNVLEAATADPALRISLLPMLEEPERDELLALARGPAPGTPRYAFVHEAVAAIDPDRIAVVQGETRLTYGELQRRVDELASRLQALDVGPGDRVAVLVSRSPALVITLLGVMRTGAAYIPMDPSYPDVRIKMMLDDGRPSAIVTDGELFERVPAVTTPMLELEATREGPPPRTPDIGPEDVAYVIFTSGSTGRPKGVMVPHRALTNFMHAMADEPGCEADDRLLAVTTASFDISALELLLPLTVGGTVDIAAPGVASDGQRLRAQLESAPPTIMQATPATWRMLIEAGWSGTEGMRVLCGGEALPRELADQLLERTDELWNMYGPTETTIWSAVHRVRPGTEDVPIGHPIRATRLYIVEPNGALAPPGSSGELYIGGDGVALGYLGQPTLTDQRFVPDPFGPDPAARLYRTGDVVRRDAQGNLVFVGRLDNQVKLRGFRIELGEIEAQLRACEGVVDAAAMVAKAGAGDERLVAYVVGDREVDLAGLRHAASKRLPSYMVPSAFMQLDAFPQTANRKLDRSALPSLVQSTSSSEPVEPRNELEARLAEVFRQTLGRDRVGVTDDFFDLGGHSLLAVRLFVNIEQEVGMALSIATLFQASTPRALAEHIQARRPG